MDCNEVWELSATAEEDLLHDSWRNSAGSNARHLYLFKLFSLDCFENSRHEENPTLDFVVMGVPQFLLLIRQSIEKLLGDDVLDADEASIRLRTIEDGALSHVLVVVRAVVVRLHLPAHVVRVEMEST